MASIATHFSAYSNASLISGLANHTEKSNVLFLEVMDAVADTKDTMIAMLHNLHQKYIQDQSLEYLLVEGDAKLYDLCNR